MMPAMTPRGSNEMKLFLNSVGTISSRKNDSAFSE
jgi:hypothetical protein